MYIYIHIYTFIYIYIYIYISSKTANTSGLWAWVVGTCGRFGALGLKGLGWFNCLRIRVRSLRAWNPEKSMMEAAGRKCWGRCMPLSSIKNLFRVPSCA